MADKQISALTAATTPTGAELVHIIQGGNSRKTTAAVLGHQFRGAKVRMTADDTTVNATSAYTISFDEATFDTDTFWSAGAPTRITITAGLGIRYVELFGQVFISAAGADSTGTIFITQFSSGDATKEAWQLGQIEKGGAAPTFQGKTGPVAVADSDYFTLRYTEETDNSITIEGDSASFKTMLAITVLGMVPV